jgi:N-acetyl-anhydromuramyl-L-alanine amidase AmpD
MIVRNTSIRDKYTRGFERSAPPRAIIIHGTGGGGTLKWMENAAESRDGRDRVRAARYRRGIGLFHYLVERDGTAVEVIDPAMWVAHSTSGDYDRGTVGIELLNPGFTNAAEYTEHQYAGLFSLVDMLMSMFPIRTIAGHHVTAVRYSGPASRKGLPPCPGNFDWERLCMHLSSGGFLFRRGREMIDDIRRDA